MDSTTSGGMMFCWDVVATEAPSRPHAVMPVATAVGPQPTCTGRHTVYACQGLNLRYQLNFDACQLVEGAAECSATFPAALLVICASVSLKALTVQPMQLLML